MIVEASGSPSEALSIFVSYSRDDLPAADQLDATLTLAGFATVMDRSGISGGEGWRERLGALIRAADTVVFVLTPKSAASEVCRWEVEEAVRLGKRIMPVLPRPLDGAPAPPALSALNYIYLYADPKKPESGLRAGLIELATALRVDVEWLREHTRYLQRATEWDTGGRPHNRLLSGDDIAIAKAWAARRPKDAPALTALHLDFIRMSEERAAQQQSEERQRLEERERLVKDREAAQTDRDAQVRTVRRRTMMGLAATLVLLLVTAGLTYWAFQLRREATVERLQATVARVAAEVAQRNAEAAEALAAERKQEAQDFLYQGLKNQSEYLAGLAAAETEKGDAGTGLLLALEALPDATSEDEVKRSRPHVPAAEVSLEGALRALREKNVLQLGGYTFSLVVSRSTGRVLVSSPNAKVYNLNSLLEINTLTKQGYISSISTDERGTKILTVENDRVRLWHSETLSEIASLDRADFHRADLNKDGSRIVLWRAQNARIIDATSLVHIWQLDLTDELSNFRFGGIFGDTLLAYTDAGKIKGWSLSTSQEFFAINESDFTPSWSLSPDETRLAVKNGQRDRVAIWDLKNGTRLVSINAKGSSWSADGAWFAAFGEGPDIRLYDASTMKEIAKVSSLHGAVTNVFFSDDGTEFISATASGVLQVWSTRTLVPMTVAHVKSGIAEILHYSKSGILTSNGDKTLRIWSSLSSAEILDPNWEARAVAITGDGARIILSGQNGSFKIVDSLSLVEIGKLQGLAAGVTRVAAGRTRGSVVTGSRDGSVRVWDGTALAPVGNFVVRAGAKIVGGAESRSPSPVHAVTMSGDEGIVFAASGGEIFAWHVASETLIDSFDTGALSILTMTVNYDGSKLITVGINEDYATVWQWDETEAAFKPKAKLPSENQVTGALFTSGGTIVTSSRDGTLREWSSKDVSLMTVRQAGGGPIVAIAGDASGELIMAASGDRSVRVWTSKTWSERATWKSEVGRLSDIASSADGSTVVAVGEGGRIQKYRLFPNGQELIDLAKKTIQRCLTPIQRGEYHLSPEAPEWCVREGKWPFDPASLSMPSARNPHARIRTK